MNVNTKTYLALALAFILIVGLPSASVSSERVDRESSLDCKGQPFGIRIVAEQEDRPESDDKDKEEDGRDPDKGSIRWTAGLLEPCHVIVQVTSAIDQILPVDLTESRIVTFRSLISLPFQIRTQGGTIRGRESVALGPGESVTLYFVPGSGVWRILNRYPSGSSRIFADSFESGNTSAWDSPMKLSIGISRK